jgi:hypothetical protein
VRNANTRLQLCHNENGWFMCYAAARSGTIIHILNNSAMGSSNICDNSKQTNFSVNLGILDVDLAFIFPIRVMLFSYQKKKIVYSPLASVCNLQISPRRDSYANWPKRQRGLSLLSDEFPPPRHKL